MSSHHIIRDEQEPALILANLDSFPFDLLGQLLEWAPYTVCGDLALDQALKYEINLDVVFSDLENVMQNLEHFPGVKLFSPEIEWINQAVEYLIKKGHKAVNIVVDEHFDRFDLLHQFADKMLVDVINPTTKYIRVENQIHKWMPSGSQLSLLGESDFQVKGGELNANEITVDQEGIVEIKSEHPFILGFSI